MLRNWSEVIPAGSPDAGALVSGTEFVGLLGSEILAATASGDHGSGLFVPWTPDAGKRYKAVVTALTGGPLRLAEDGSGEADAAFTATLSVYEDNLLVSDSITVTGAIVVETYEGGGDAVVSASAVGEGQATEAASGGGDAIVAAVATGEGAVSGLTYVERAHLRSWISRRASLSSRLDLEQQ